ncbi:MAG: hypothetical protein ACJA01_001201 [Saprospiraceae bacterium]
MESSQKKYFCNSIYIEVKYRRFTTDELVGLEEDFSKYLVINGITSDDWLRLKSSETQKAEDIIDTFSDVIWQSILRKAQYIDLYEAQVITSYHCDAEAITMCGLFTKDASFDFTTAESIALARNAPPKDLEYFSSKKVYTKSREEEIYDLIFRGGQISKGELYNSLESSK